MPHLPEAVESILSQTAADFRILVILDGADDQSLGYLQSLNDSRLRVVEQPHLGLTATLNRMLREVETGWLVRQDADDVSWPTRIERIQQAIAENPGAGMFYSFAKYHPPNRSLGLFRCSRGSPAELRSIVQSGYLLSICHPTAVLNVEKTLAIGGYRNLPHAEDADLWWRMALNYDIQLIPEVLVGFRQNADSVSAKNAYTQELHGLYIQYLLLSHLAGRHPLSLAESAALLEAHISSARLKSKQLLRECNMHLGARRYPRALLALLHSLFTSPAFLARRVFDELAPRESIANGILPDLLYRQKDALWPSA